MPPNASAERTLSIIARTSSPLTPGRRVDLLQHGVDRMLRHGLDGEQQPRVVRRPGRIALGRQPLHQPFGVGRVDVVAAEHPALNTRRCEIAFRTTAAPFAPGWLLSSSHDRNGNGSPLPVPSAQSSLQLRRNVDVVGLDRVLDELEAHRDALPERLLRLVERPPSSPYSLRSASSSACIAALLCAFACSRSGGRMLWLLSPIHAIARPWECRPAPWRASRTRPRDSWR
jgi:hypothetical protein